MQALVGAMSVTGFPDAPPVKCGPTFIDMLGGTHLLAGILMALRTRDATGRGTRVEVAMLDAAVAAMLSYLAPYYEFGAEISRSAIREATHPDRGPVKVLGNPIHLDGEPQPDLAPAPGLGADTDAVFRELLGMDPEEVARLREAGVV